MRTDRTTPEFREAFRNRIATDVAIGPHVATLGRLFFGLFTAVLLLLSVSISILALAHIILGIDPLGKAVFQDLPKGVNGLIAALAGLLFTLLFFGTMSYLSLRAVKRRWSARVHVISGQPLRFIEGSPIFDEASDTRLSGNAFTGVQIKDFYFSFDDCWLNVDDNELARLRSAGGTLRVWYIPAGLRTGTSPATGLQVHYDAMLVRAEWRPQE